MRSNQVSELCWTVNSIHSRRSNVIQHAPRQFPSPGSQLPLVVNIDTLPAPLLPSAWACSSRTPFVSPLSAVPAQVMHPNPGMTTSNSRAFSRAPNGVHNHFNRLVGHHRSLPNKKIHLRLGTWGMSPLPSIPSCDRSGKLPLAMPLWHLSILPHSGLRRTLRESLPAMPRILPHRPAPRRPTAAEAAGQAASAAWDVYSTRQPKRL
jgi:hypothetical protein